MTRISKPVSVKIIRRRVARSQWSPRRWSAFPSRILQPSRSSRDRVIDLTIWPCKWMGVLQGPPRWSVQVQGCWSPVSLCNELVALCISVCWLPNFKVDVLRSTKKRLIRLSKVLQLIGQLWDSEDPKEAKAPERKLWWQGWLWSFCRLFRNFVREFFQMFSATPYLVRTPVNVGIYWHQAFS